MAKERLILITNDDGIHAKGLKALYEAMKGLGKIVVVAPLESQSGMSQAITVRHPLRIKKNSLNGYEVFSVNGTPTDCVKLSINRILQQKPDLLVSGINHGSNSSSSVLYSGTIGAALEGALIGIPSLGFSLISYDKDADFDVAVEHTRKITKKILENQLPPNTCLNINIPYLPSAQIKGIRICRQTMGYWKEEFEQRVDPSGNEYYWLTGEYYNTEPDADDTDEWALKNNYISIVPLKVDLTCYTTFENMKQWNF